MSIRIMVLTPGSAILVATAPVSRAPREGAAPRPPVGTRKLSLNP